MKLSIGIPACNEAEAIPSMLRSLFEQALLQQDNPDCASHVEIIVLPNGCTDDTAEAAKQTLQQLAPADKARSPKWRVCSVEEPGKANAWNRFVHEFSDPDAEVLVFMDSDIRLVEPNTLCEMEQILQSKPSVEVVAGKPLKDICLKTKRTFWDRISLAMSWSSKGAPARISGSLYCGRARTLRKYWMPTGLQVDDAFVKAMVLTDGFTGPESFERIAMTSKPSHVFEAYTNFFRLVRHERWIVCGSVVNAYLFGFLWGNCGPMLNGGELIRRRNADDPRWLANLIDRQFEERGWWIVPRGILFRRFLLVRRRPVHKFLMRMLIVSMALPLDLLICLQANRQLRNGYALRYWGKGPPPAEAQGPTSAHAPPVAAAE